MKTSGVSRKIDEVGRIVIPKSIRKKQGLIDGTPLDISLEGDKIIMQKSQSSCLFCNESAELTKFKGRRICKKCLAELKDIS